MTESQTEMAERWDVMDLLDLDHFLQQDTDLDEADLVSRDEKIAREDLLPVLGEAAMVGDAEQRVRSRGIWIWLQARKNVAAKQQKDELSLMPGEVFAQVSRLMRLLGGGVMLALGVSLVFSLLHKEERYFDAMKFLAVTLLPQLILMLLLVGGWVFRGMVRTKSAGVAQILLGRLMFWLGGKVRRRRMGEELETQWQTLKQRSYLAWPLVAMTQMMAVLYNLGILAGFAACLVSMDVRFFWESTPGLAAVEALEKIVAVVSCPWGMLVHDFLPTSEGIAATRIIFEGAQKIYPLAEVKSAAVWVPFLAGAVVFWGLLPRLFLRIGIGIWGKRSIKRFPFVERRYRELWRRLTALRVETSSEGPDDEAVILLWGGLNPDPQELRKVLLQQLRLNPVKTFAAGNETDVSGDAKVIRQVGDALSEMKPRVRLVIVVESWALAPREATDFLNELRGWVGQDRAVRLLLLGPPIEGSPFSEPSAVEMKTWEGLAAERKDAYLTVYPYRKRHG